MNDSDEGEALAAGDPLVFGAIVGICRLADCVRIEEISGGLLDERFPHLHDRKHCGGPWCWVLTDVLRIAPIPCRGAQGLWEVPDGLAPALGDAVRSASQRSDQVTFPQPSGNFGEFFDVSQLTMTLE